MRSNVERLIGENYGLILSQVVRFHPSPTDFEDYLQVAILAFIKGLSSFDKDKGMFSTYIVNCMRNRLSTYKTYDKKLKQLPDELSYSGPERLDDFLPSDLTLFERELIAMKVESYSIKEIADHIGVKSEEIKIALENIYVKIRASNKENVE